MGSNFTYNNATLYPRSFIPSSLPSPPQQKKQMKEEIAMTYTRQGAGVYAANLNHSWNIFGALFTDNWSSSLRCDYGTKYLIFFYLLQFCFLLLNWLFFSGDSNIACNPSAMQFCYACTAKDCVTGCGISSAQSCSQNSVCSLFFSFFIWSRSSSRTYLFLFSFPFQNADQHQERLVLWNPVHNVQGPRLHLQK